MIIKLLFYYDKLVVIQKPLFQGTPLNNKVIQI